MLTASMSPAQAESVTTATDELAQFNKAEANGFSCDVRAYAYLPTTREVTNSLTRTTQIQTVNYLYYLDLIARDAQTLNAILPGLVKEPAPNPVRLYHSASDETENLDEEIENDVTGNATSESNIEKGANTKGLLMWAAEKKQVGTRKLFSTPLKRACAYEGVLIPTAALPNFYDQDELKSAPTSATAAKPTANNNNPDNKNQAKEKQTTSTSAQPSQTKTWFVLLLLDDLPELKKWPLSELYHTRLKKLISLPLLPEWHEWTWQFGTEASLIQPLACKGGSGYLCQVPDETLLQQALQGAIVNRRIYCGPELPRQQNHQEVAVAVFNPTSEMSERKEATDQAHSLELIPVQPAA